MDIAITGSTGFLGTALTERLRAQGHHVVPVVRPQTKGGNPDAIEWDPPADQIDARALEGLDAVVHLAGVSIGSGRGTQKNLAAIRDSRTIPTALLARTLAGLSNPPRVLLSQSAVGYYGDRGEDLLDEEQPAGEDFLARVCADWEAATRPAEEAGIRVVRTRTGLVLDPAGGLLKKLLLPVRAGLGAWFGSGRQWQSWITLGDMTGAMSYLLTADARGPVNLAAPNPVRNREMTEQIARAVRRRALFGVPQGLLELGAGRELGQAMTGGQRVDVSKLRGTGFAFGHENLDEALDEILGKR